MIVGISWPAAILISAVGLAAILVVLAAAIGYRLARRSGAVADERTANLLEDLRSRVDDLRHEVSEALEQSREPAHERPFDQAASIDLDAVLGQVLVAARAVPGADAALVTVAAPGGDPLTRADGLTSRDEQREPLWPPPGRFRTLRLDYDARGEPARIKAGLVVPIRADAAAEAGPGAEIETPPEAEARLETIGLLSIFARSDPGAFSEADVQELECLGRRAAPAVNNALRFRDAQRRAVIDGPTGLHNKTYFKEALAREVLRAERHKRPLALLAFDLDDFKAINDRYGHPAADAVVAEIAKRIRESRARPADIACRTGAGDEFAVILPESTLEGAAQVYQRLRAAIEARPVAHVDPVSLSAGIAELWAHENDLDFFRRANDVQRQAKRYGKGRVAASTTLEQAARQASFTIWVPEHVPPEWAIQVTHLPALGMLSVAEAGLITYASTAEGGEVLSLTESSPTEGEGGADVRAALRVVRGGTTILLESKTAGTEWLARVAETLVPVPVEPPKPPVGS